MTETDQSSVESWIAGLTEAEREKLAEALAPYISRWMGRSAREGRYSG